MIYHIVQRLEWSQAKKSGLYEPESLFVEGYIHCSTENQFDQVANFYFKGHSDLIVLEIDEEKVADRLKWDSVGTQKFPRIYGPLEASEIERETELAVNEDDIFEFPFKPILH